MRLMIIFFTLLISASTYAYDSIEGEMPMMNPRGHFASAPVMELNSEDYDSMVTSINASVESDSTDDNIADYSDDERD